MIPSAATRQPRPVATAAPISSGAVRPTQAATALASVRARGPDGPWRSDNAALATFISMDPHAAATSTASSTPGKDGTIASRTPAVASPPAALSATVRLPQRRISEGPTSPDNTRPAASATPVSPANVNDTPSCSAIRGVTGPRKYRKKAYVATMP